MRIHNNTLTIADVVEALAGEIAAGRIAKHVSFKVLQGHGSKTHVHAFEVQLSASQPGDGRRAGNTGSYGSMGPEDGYAATYDEWGWLIAALYKKEPKAIWGTPKNPQYADISDFAEKTGFTYFPADLALIIIGGIWPRWYEGGAGYDGDPYPYTIGRSAGKIGRRGAGRYSTTQGRRFGGKYNPRDVLWLEAFAKGDVK